MTLKYSTFSSYYWLGLLVLLLSACTTTTNVTTTTPKEETTTTAKTIDGNEVVVRTAGETRIEIPDTVRLQPDPYSALVEMETNFGTMKIELFFDAGEHRANFLKLAKSNVYDSLLFHRVIKNFMAQGGDPDSKFAKAGDQLGTGSVGYEVPAEIGQQYYHIKGALAAARQPDEINPEKKSSGSQFYIVQGANVSSTQLDKNEREYDMVYTEKQRQLYKKLGGSPQLDMEYTVFGRVYDGFEVIDAICQQPTDGVARPKEDIWFKVKVIRE